MTIGSNPPGSGQIYLVLQAQKDDVQVPGERFYVSGGLYVKTRNMVFTFPLPDEFSLSLFLGSSFSLIKLSFRVLKEFYSLHFSWHTGY